MVFPNLFFTHPVLFFRLKSEDDEMSTLGWRHRHQANVKHTLFPPSLPYNWGGTWHASKYLSGQNYSIIPQKVGIALRLAAVARTDTGNADRCREIVFT